MNRAQLLELLRTFIAAFIIAFVINLLRIAFFENGDFASLMAFSREERMINNLRQNMSRYQTQSSTTYNETVVNKPSINKFENSNIIEIPVEQPLCFNNLSANDILDLRNRSINTSPIFSDMNYKPSTDVFSIRDYKPWISIEGALHFSKRKGTERTEGPSRDSIGILNPELLYYISISENEDAESADFKTLYKDFDFKPYRVTYDPATNTITAYIKNEHKDGNYQPLFLSDSNAHDLGYNYAIMDTSKNIGFYTDSPYKDSTLKSDIQKTTGYYMVGSACKVEGGCNNYAPYWQYYNFLFIRRFPASFNIKLWKTRPRNSEQKADINFSMVFE